MKAIQDYPIYSIGIMSELLGIPTETIRLWERSGVIQPPQRRSGKRFYSEKELRRLQFVRNLSKEGLSIRAIIYYLRHYPCWKVFDCPSPLHNSNQIVSVKPCWQEDATFCQLANTENPCASCDIGVKPERYETKEKELEKIGTQNRPLTNQDSTLIQSKPR
ncbi:MerR family transcriptional regulator [Chloroflexota bacterium]